MDSETKFASESHVNSRRLLYGALRTAKWRLHILQWKLVANRRTNREIELNIDLHSYQLIQLIEVICAPYRLFLDSELVCPSQNNSISLRFSLNFCREIGDEVWPLNENISSLIIQAVTNRGCIPARDYCPERPAQENSLHQSTSK